MPTNNPQVKYTLKSRPKGITVLNVSGPLLTGAPFVTFSLREGILYFNQVTGLSADKDYDLSIVVYGN